MEKILPDKPQEACGVFGLSVTDPIAVHSLLYSGLLAQQHRGEDGTGVAFFGENQELFCYKSQDLVSPFMTKANWISKKSMCAIGHVRYGTQGGQDLSFVQPVSNKGENVALAFNGQLNILNSTCVSDSQLLLQRYLAYKHQKITLESLLKADGENAFSAVAVHNNRLIAFRDRQGVRPLYWGIFQKEDNRGVAVASETCAFTMLGISKIYEVAPGEILEWEEAQLVSRLQAEGACKKFCAFEGLYFSREDSCLFVENPDESEAEKKDCYCLRKALGKQLAVKEKNGIKEKNLTDVVVPVPQSGIPAAMGYANARGISMEFALVKDRYQGRSFIQSSEKRRKATIEQKLHLVPSAVYGKRVFVVDDTLVRGHTMRHIVSKLKGAGAREVHVRIAAPPIVASCRRGIDTGRETKLSAKEMSISQISSFLGADSLVFLDQADLSDVLGSSICLDCFG